ncbi:MAG: hypothetical protein JRN68_05105 [Nitrososphaerota archaeon]|jgi:predicted fused transcriptional regulator/phosphomethylpyrimidine kinase/predicted transcriptional regulator|nr:hypothetical protein [Nitrososphaerota archaeon]
MKDPFEYVAKEYLPWMKGLISIDLSTKGLSQSNISSLIGVTQPSVNYYLKKQRQDYLRKLERIGLSDSTIKDQEQRFIEALLADTKDRPAKVIQTVVDALVSGELCDYHRKTYNVPVDCDACMRLWGSGTSTDRSSVVQELGRAVELLEHSEYFVHLIPEVHSNFVLASADPKNVNDVAGIGGRIVRVKGRARAMSRPEFGASRHLAGVLLVVHQKFADVRSAINVKFDEELRECMLKLGWRLLDIPVLSLEHEDPVMDAVSHAISSVNEKPDVLVQEGETGLEPSAYIIGSDPFEVVTKTLDLASLYARERTRVPSVTG